MNRTAAVAHSLRSPLVFEEVELPDLQPADVVVRIVAVGICHTDIASRDGQLPAPFPSIDLLAQGRFPFDEFVRFYPFTEINRAAEDQRNGIAIKPILEVSFA